MDQRELKSELYYNKETGAFTWKVSNNNRIKVGDEAGSISKRNGYIQIKIKKRLYRAHRLAWLYVYGVMPTKEIDHIDHDRTNNKISNLREVTRQQNSKNTKIRSDNKSGVTGVNWNKKTFKWYARIHDESGCEEHLGYFNNFDEARQARLKAESKYNYHANHGGL